VSSCLTLRHVLSVASIPTVAIQRSHPLAGWHCWSGDLPVCSVNSAGWDEPPKFHRTPGGLRVYPAPQTTADTAGVPVATNLAPPYTPLGLEGPYVGRTRRPLPLKHHPAPNVVARELRSELRRFIRAWHALASPFCLFRKSDGRGIGLPQYFVCFDIGARPRPGVGLRAGMKSLARPDERLDDAAHFFLGAIWQLKDRLKQWCTVRGLKLDVEGHVTRHSELLICADLFNRKKHGEHTDRSRMDPWIDLPVLDLSRSGVIEVLHDGAVKETLLYVTDANPIPCSMSVCREARRYKQGARPAPSEARIEEVPALGLRALTKWLPLVHAAGVLTGDDPECTALRRELAQLDAAFADTEPSSNHR